MSKALKIIFAGTPDFAAAALQACIQSSHEVVAVFTQPDRPAGRGRKVRNGPVKQLAIDAGIPVHQPLRLEQEQFSLIQKLQADVMLVSAYGLLLPKDILALPKFGCINIHASLLPRWRGAAPIQRAIIAGDKQTGISIMQMVEALDAGPVLQQFKCEIQDTDTGSSLHDRLADIAKIEIIPVLENLQSGLLSAHQQDEAQVCYAKKITKQEANINWQLNAEEIVRQVRAFNSWPISYTFLGQQRIRIWEAVLSPTQSDALANKQPGAIVVHHKQNLEVVTGKGVITLNTVQLAGGKVISAKDFINAQDVKGQYFTAEASDNPLRALA